ncbi:MAG: SDR family oxidoreductase [Anaerolineales bacterium]|nr:SDR family oxidoreductase [Anaerolineales bacterium]
MRVLVTGASGLLGLNLALAAAPEHTVYGVVHRNRLRTDAFTVIRADLLEDGAVERVLEQAQPDWIIHCAALANVDDCERHPELARRLNWELPKRLAAATRGGARLMHISTDAVFDGARGDYTEEDAPNPLSVYARTKLDGERIVAEENPDAIVARVNLFGWSISGKRSLAEFFFNSLSQGKQVNGFTDVYFCPLLASHLAGLLLRMHGAGLRGLYHAVSAECLNKYDFGLAVADKFGFDARLITPIQVSQSGLTAARSPHLTLSTGKLAAALGAPLPSWREGLDAFYKQFREGYPERIREMKG